MRKVSLVLAGVLCVSGSAWARGPFVGELPNGNTFNCKNCHTEAAGGSPLNAFGQLTADRPAGDGGVLPYLNWAAYARADSDGDGFTNGQELGDPCGDWRPGQPQPTLTAVGNPGEAASTPTGAPAACAPASSSGGGDSGPGCSSSGEVPAAALLGALVLVMRRRRR